jgi:hypothetical protein
VYEYINRFQGFLFLMPPQKFESTLKVEERVAYMKGEASHTIFEADKFKRELF